MSPQKRQGKAKIKLQKWIKLKSSKTNEKEGWVRNKPHVFFPLLLCLCCIWAKNLCNNPCGLKFQRPLIHTRLWLTLSSHDSPAWMVQWSAPPMVESTNPTVPKDPQNSLQLHKSLQFPLSNVNLLLKPLAGMNMLKILHGFLVSLVSLPIREIKIKRS